MRIPNKVNADGSPAYKVEITPFADDPRGRKLAEIRREELYFELYRGQKPTTWIGDSPSMKEAFDRFIKERHISEKTEQGYEHAFNAIVTNPRLLVNRENLRDCAIQFRKKRTDLSPVSINTYLREYRVFVRWCEYTFEIPTVRLTDQMVHQPDPEPNPLSDKECRVLLSDDSVPQITLLSAFMIETGARRVDALTLKVSDVDMKKGIAVWSNKISKLKEPRPLSSRAIAIIVAMKKYRRGDLIAPWHYSQVRNVCRAFDRLQLRTGFAKSDEELRSLKTLRQTFLRRIEVMPESMQKWLMRHHSRDVTERHYRSRDFEDIRKRLDELPIIDCSLVL